MANIKYTDFFKAMSNNNYELCDLTPEEYGACLVEFKLRMDIKDGPLQKQMGELDIDIMLLTNSLIYVPVLGAKDEDIQLLKKLKVQIVPDIQGLIDNIQIRLNQIVSKAKMINGELPKLKQLFVITGQDVIAELSLAIEIALPMDLSLLDYVSYNRAARNKSKLIKKKMS